MGNKDKTWDENATTSTSARDQEQESRDMALARTIAQAVAEAFTKQEADETKFIMETFTRQMEKTQVQYEELLKASHTQNFPSTLKVTSSSEGFRVMDPFDWTRDKTSTRDGSCGLTRPSLHWMPWRETMKRPRSPTCIIGWMAKVSQRSRDGRTAKFSSARKSMTHYQKEKERVSTLLIK